jgi:alpha-L-fucosidase
MYDPNRPEYKYHVANYGDQDEFDYADFVPMFKAKELLQCYRPILQIR